MSVGQKKKAVYCPKVWFAFHTQHPGPAWTVLCQTFFNMHKQLIRLLSVMGTVVFLDLKVNCLFSDFS